MKFSFLAGLGFTRYKAKDVVKSLKDLGYDGVEWTLAHFNPRTKSDKELAEVVKVTRDGGLEISELAIQLGYVWLEEEKRKDLLALTKESIQACARHGIGVANVFTGPVPWIPEAPRVGINIKEGDAWKMAFDAFDEIVPLAEKNKVRLAMEGVWGMLVHGFYQSKFLVNHYNSDYLGVNLDVSHGILLGNLDVGWVVKQWGKKIYHVHLKDAVGVAPDKFIFPMLGEGFVNWKEFFDALREIDYKGFCSVEYESFKYYADVFRDDPVAAAKISMEQIKKLTTL